MDIIPRWADRYRGIPFANFGSDRMGCNCWGLVALVLHEQCAIEVDRYGHIGADEVLAACHAMDDAAKIKTTWRDVDRDHVRAFDVVLLRDIGRRFVRHIGIMASPSHVLHIEKGIDAACVELKNALIESRIVSFHRHVLLPR